jgi:hypothetical protein
MTRTAAAAAVMVCLLIVAGAPAAYGHEAQDPVAQNPPPVVRDVRITGAEEIASADLLDAMRVAVGSPLPVPVDHLQELSGRITAFYQREGYTFATATTSFDVADGVLAVTIDEGTIDDVEFTGVDDRLKRIFAEEFAMRAGDVFNRGRARQALDVLLQQTRGAVRPGRIFERGGQFYDTRELKTRASDSRGTFDLVNRNGRRTLLVGVYEAAGRFKLVPDLGDREDWFTPVDGFVPSLGFGAAVFDHQSFNHSYVAGHLSYKMASHRAGYTLGFERPFFAARKLYIGGELHDLTASDDQWQLSSIEASLAAIGPRKSFRDYYLRRGVQLNAAFRPHPNVELLGAWRGERHEALPLETDFSLWNGDEPFRPNTAAGSGRMNSLIVGGSLSGEKFDRESLDATYRRHQLDTLFGEPLPDPRRANAQPPQWRVDWTSEFSSPGALASDFDFGRHILSGRYRRTLTPHQEFGARAIRGWSGGTLPPQRLFAIGGIGSVHGYEFKEAIGESMTLVNLEYALGWRHAFQVFGFYDAGRIDSTPWLKGIGWGIGAGGIRVDFGYRTSDIPGSLKVTLRFGRSF